MAIEAKRGVNLRIWDAVGRYGARGRCLPVPEQYQQRKILTAGYTILPNANNVIGTTYQHNTDTTMGITITDNLVDTTLYQDH